MHLHWNQLVPTKRHEMVSGAQRFGTFIEISTVVHPCHTEMERVQYLIRASALNFESLPNVIDTCLCGLLRRLLPFPLP